MTTPPRDAEPDAPVAASHDDDEILYCYGHPKEPTRLRCTRCDRPICGRCAIPASVGQHCPECVAEARRSAPKVRSVMTANAPIVTALLAVNIAVFVFQQLSPDVTFRFASFPRAIAAGEWWRLITAMFLHHGPLHILLNGFVLWVYGPTAEEAYGRVRFAAIYLVSGFVAATLSYAFGPEHALSAGASGAIFGLVGALVAYLYHRRRSAFVAHYLRNLGTFIALNLVLGFVIANIDYWAHIGGLAAGLALGFGLERAADRRTSPFLQAAVIVAVAAVGLLLAVNRTAGLT